MFKHHDLQTFVFKLGKYENFHPLAVVSRVSEAQPYVGVNLMKPISFKIEAFTDLKLCLAPATPQLQVSKKYFYLYNLNKIQILRSDCSHFSLKYSCLEVK